MADEGFAIELLQLKEPHILSPEGGRRVVLFLFTVSNAFAVFAAFKRFPTKGTSADGGKSS